MYISKYLKMRILVARKLDELYFEPENVKRCHKRVYELYAYYLLGVNYDTFLSYLNPGKFQITDMKLPGYIIKSLKTLDANRLEE